MTDVRTKRSLLVALLILAAPPRAHAQHHDEARDTSSRRVSPHASPMHVQAQAIPLVTRASPTAGGVARVEGAVAQTVVMARGAWRDGTLALDLTLDGEGLTMPRGELSTGAYGEGYVDRRHPHTYLHELVLTAMRGRGAARASISAGRGFVPFGTDDPMVRPLVKYPIDHHLAQILERALVAGALRVGPAILEGSTFGGEEPVHPTSLPRAARFGDSWSTRLTLLPTSAAELQTSYARVASPEEQGGFGLDQRKTSASLRVRTDDDVYLLVEWARTVEHDHNSGLDAFSYEAALAEGALRVLGATVALRLEQADRPEEERLADPFRTARPAADLSISGITRWRVATLHVGAREAGVGALRAQPFLEVARLSATPRDARSVFQPERAYGTSRFWMLSAGVRLGVGTPHGRMGRYGAARAESAPMLADHSSTPHIH